MENKTISRTLRLLSQLMELHEENPFKIKSVAGASVKIDKLPVALKDVDVKDIDKVDGVGKSIASKVIELLTTGQLQELNDIISKTPEGIVEMLSIKGIGPKKIAIIWKDLGIENIGELYYACNENRLIEAKGFGLKTQEEIKKAIEFKMASNGRFLYAQIVDFANDLNQKLHQWLNNIDLNSSLAITGEFRRKCEIIDVLEFTLGTENIEQVISNVNTFEHLNFSPSNNSFTAISEEGLKIVLNVVEKHDFALAYFQQTGNLEHVKEVLALAGKGPFNSEVEIYEKAKLQFVEPELREGYNEIELAAQHNLPKLIEFNDLKGTLHNHSTWSDGVHTLEQMAVYSKDILGLEYLGICDHSKSAFYANGLNEQRLIAQHQEIDALNQKLAPFKIFKGIESDILNDGSLDYSDDILKTFDFVVASVHSNLRMDEEKATNRLIKAIENPYTTILGHPTGRLLLSRAGYPIDFKKVIDACAANNVVIEINANPLRLDLDWRWHRYALEKGVLLSINPDAHRTEGLHDMHYGVFVARKGGLSAKHCLNAYNLEEIANFFGKKKNNII